MIFFIYINLLSYLFISYKIYKMHGEGLLVSPAFIYLVFHGIGFVLKPFLIYYAGFSFVYRHIDFQLDANNFNFTIFVSLIGLIALYAGLSLAFANKKLNYNFLKEIKTRVYIPHKYDYRVLIFLAIIIAPVGLHSLININTLHEAMSHYNVYFVKIFQKSSGYYFFSNIALGSLFLLFFFLRKFSILSSIPLIIYLYIRIEYGWSRYSFILIFITLGILLLIYNIDKKKIFLFGATLIAILFQFVGRTRAESGISFANWDNLDIANFESLSFITKIVPDITNSFTYFSQYLQFFTEPIPRLLWSDKPIGPPITFFNLNDYGNFNVLTTSLIGDGWMSFGYLGIVLMMLLTGYLCGKIFIGLTNNINDPVFAFLYSVQIPTLIMWYRDGGIGVLKIFLFYAMPILIWHFMRKNLKE